MPVLTARGLSHSFGDRQILDEVSFSIGRGERIGFIGDNGSGKSTLASILVGKLKPDAGEVALRKGASLAYLSQEADFGVYKTPRAYILAGNTAWSAAMERHEQLTAQLSEKGGATDSVLAAQSDAADAIERHGGWDVMHQVEDVAAHLGVSDLDKSVDAMSGGERRRVALARVLIAKPALAILDEPTNHLDVATIEWLEQYLTTDFPGAVLLITHDRYVLDRVAQRTIELSEGKIYEYSGGWEGYLVGKAERLAQAERREANRQNTLRRELDWLRRSPKARSTKQQARVDRAVALRDATPEGGRPDKLQFDFTATRSGKTLIDLSELVVSIGGRTLIDGLDLVVKAGDRIGIVGDNGAGKTSLLRVVLEELAPVGGKVVIGKNARFAYFDQERTDLDDDRSVRDNVAGERDVVEVAGQPVNTISYLAKMSFPPEKQRQKVGSLSGGERARVSLAKFLLSKANILLLDEPTNDLDVGTLASLEEMLVDTSATAIFVTHDRYFLDRVATSVLAFETGGRVVQYADSHQALAAAREERRSGAGMHAASKPVRATGSQAAPKSKSKGLTFTEKHELEGMMSLIEEAEQDVGTLEAELADPDLYAKRGAEVPVLQGKLERAQRLVEERVARWEHLEEKR